MPTHSFEIKSEVIIHVVITVIMKISIIVIIVNCGSSNNHVS